MTISGYPLGSKEDMDYHRATGEQVPKVIVIDSLTKSTEYVETQPGSPRFDGSAAYEHYLDTMAAEAMLGDVPIRDIEYYANGRTVLSVGSAEDFDKLAAMGLPEGVIVVDTSEALDESYLMGKQIGRDVIGSLAGSPDALERAKAMGYVFPPGSYDATVNGGSLMMDIEAGHFDDILAPGYVPTFGFTKSFYEESFDIKPRAWRDTARRSAVTDKNEARVAKDRARNKAARKTRRNQRRK